MLRGGQRVKRVTLAAKAANNLSGFPIPLIKSDMPISRIRLSNWLLFRAHSVRPIHLILSERIICHCTLQPLALPGITDTMALSDSRLDQHLKHRCGSRARVRRELPRYPGFRPHMLSPLPGGPKKVGRLRPAKLLQPLRISFVPIASAGGSLQSTVWLANGMNRQFPGRDLHPLASSTLVAHLIDVVG